MQMNNPKVPAFDHKVYLFFESLLEFLYMSHRQVSLLEAFCLKDTWFESAFGRLYLNDNIRSSNLPRRIFI
jgi:hypothetical protein